MKKLRIGVVGLAVMGKNLAFNIESKGFSVAVYNRSPEKTRELVAEAQGKHLIGTYSVEEFVQSLETPRKMLIMVKAGQPTDDTIEQIIPYCGARMVEWKDIATYEQQGVWKKANGAGKSVS